MKGLGAGRQVDVRAGWLTGRWIGWPVDWPAGRMVWVMAALAVAVRLAAALVLRQPLVSDSLAYFDLARSMAMGLPPTDNFGQHAFFSIGYPLLLVPFFAALGASVGVALGVNAALAAVSVWLVDRLAAQCAMGTRGRALAMLFYALWLPGIWNATMLARENLSAPLMLALALVAVRLSSRPGERALWGLSLLGGVLWGMAILAGASALPLGGALALGVAVALWPRFGQVVGHWLVLAVAMLAVLAPWGWATQAMLGRPALTTSSGFNLYIGNNPAATGRFVSIAATPAGPDWKPLLASRGEAGAGAELGHRALAWMAQNPTRVMALSIRKLALFWAPYWPDAADFHATKAKFALKLLGALQYLLFAVLGLGALVFRGVPGRARAVLAMAILGFWALHGLVYIIDRYRDPVMPVVIVLAAALVELFQAESRGIRAAS